MTVGPPDWKFGAECSTCGATHAVCTFRTGLFCVDDPCNSPHHRVAPESTDERKDAA